MELNTIATWLEDPMHRYATSGTLITVYMLFDLGARWMGKKKAKTHPPRWLHPMVFVVVTAFYALIGPTGGPLAGGAANLVGAGLVVAAGLLRLFADVKFPELAGRGLLYVALPLAVGVPWGWLVLSLPAVAASVWCIQRAEENGVAPALPRYRLVPGIW